MANVRTAERGDGAVHEVHRAAGLLEGGGVMGLLVCVACDRCQERSPIQRLRYYCINCGAYFPRVIHRRKWWMDPKNGIIKQEALTRTYAGLKWIRENRNYSRGYSAVKFKVIFGYWPPDYFELNASQPPTAGLIRFIARENAQWKALKRAEEKEKGADRAGASLRVYVTSPLMADSDWDVKL